MGVTHNDDQIVSAYEGQKRDLLLWLMKLKTTIYIVMQHLGILCN